MTIPTVSEKDEVAFLERYCERNADVLERMRTTPGELVSTYKDCRKSNKALTAGAFLESGRHANRPGTPADHESYSESGEQDKIRLHWGKNAEAYKAVGTTCKDLLDAYASMCKKNESLTAEEFLDGINQQQFKEQA